MPGLVNADPDAASAGPGAFPEVVVRGTDSHLPPREPHRGGAAQRSAGSASGSHGRSTRILATRRLLSRDGPCALSTVLACWRRLAARMVRGRRHRHLGPGRRVTGRDALVAAGVRPRHRRRAVPALLGRWVGRRLPRYLHLGSVGDVPGPTRLDVFCRGTDMAIWHRYWLHGSGWGAGSASTASSSRTPKRHHPGLVVCRRSSPGPRPRVYQFWWNGSRWTSTSWGIL